jgi:hypothetical protein
MAKRCIFARTTTNSLDVEALQVVPLFLGCCKLPFEVSAFRSFPGVILKLLAVGRPSKISAAVCAVPLLDFADLWLNYGSRK